MTSADRYGAAHVGGTGIGRYRNFKPDQCSRPVVERHDIHELLDRENDLGRFRRQRRNPPQARFVEKGMTESARNSLHKTQGLLRIEFNRMCRKLSARL